MLVWKARQRKRGEESQCRQRHEVQSEIEERHSDHHKPLHVRITLESQLSTTLISRLFVHAWFNSHLLSKLILTQNLKLNIYSAQPLLCVTRSLHSILDLWLERLISVFLICPAIVLDIRDIFVRFSEEARGLPCIVRPWRIERSSRAEWKLGK